MSGDAVANKLSLPFDPISLEMIFRGLYHFSIAYDPGIADDPIKIKYFADTRKSRFRSSQNAAKTNLKAGLSPFSCTLVDIGAITLTSHEWL